MWASKERVVASVQRWIAERTEPFGCSSSAELHRDYSAWLERTRALNWVPFAGIFGHALRSLGVEYYHANGRPHYRGLSLRK